jgi:hypothetical protein
VLASCKVDRETAARWLPKRIRHDRLREWEADLYQLQDRKLSAFIWAIGILIHAPSLGRIELGLPPVRDAVFKRVFDRALAAVMLLAFAPLFAVIALAIRLTSDGPVLSRTHRVRRDGRRITLYRFRTEEWRFPKGSELPSSPCRL